MGGYKIQAGVKILLVEGWEGSQDVRRQIIQVNDALSLNLRL